MEYRLIFLQKFKCVYFSVTFGVKVDVSFLGGI